MVSWRPLICNQHYNRSKPSNPKTFNACFLRWLIRNPTYQRKSAIIVSDLLHGERSGKRSGTRFDSVATVAGTQPKRDKLSRNSERTYRAKKASTKLRHLSQATAIAAEASVLLSVVVGNFTASHGGQRLIHIEIHTLHD